jgi:glutathione S-transferase
MSLPASAAKFDPARAHEYAEQSRIALAGYDACHELTACMLASAIDAPEARILVAGAGGTGQEICVAAALEPGWQFTAIDPSAPMLALARSNVEAAGFGARTAFVEDGVDALPDASAFDGATLIGVLHHVPGDEAKAALLRAIARRLKPGAPLVLAGNHRRYADHPRLLDAWQQRWRMKGATPDAVRAIREDPAGRRSARVRGSRVRPAARRGLRCAAALFLEPVLGRVGRGAARVMERAVGQTRPARRGSSRSAMRFAYTRRATRAGYDVVPVPTSGVDMLTVHHLNNSRSQRVLWLLEELDVPYEIVRYARDPKTMLAPPELRAIHPLGKSPVVTDEGRTYAESGAIIEYLVERYGNGRLAPPPGAPERHDYTYWLHYAEGSAMPPLLLKLVALRIAHAPMPFFARPIARKIADTLQSSFVDPQIALHLGYVNDTLSRTGWFVGDGFSAADIQMSFPLEAATARGGGSRYPAIARFLDAIHARPAYQRALERGGPYDLLK